MSGQDFEPSGNPLHAGINSPTPEGYFPQKNGHP
jgi:hypothetical protein